METCHDKLSSAPRAIVRAALRAWRSYAAAITVVLMAWGAQILWAQGDPTYVSSPVRPYVIDVDVRTLPVVQPSTDSHARLSAPDSLVTPHAIHGPDALRSEGGEGAFGLAVTPPEFANPSPNIDGISGGGNPPDTNGAPGPNHYIQTINQSFAIFSKAGALLAGPTPIQNLWNDPSVPVDDDCRLLRSDPYVIYDHLADRFVITEIANKGPEAGDPLMIQCIAVTRGPNPVTDGWYLYTFDLGVSNDYPKLAVWPDGYYLITQEGYDGGNLDATVFDRANMLNGNPATFQRKSFLNGHTIIALPSELSGPSPAPGAPNIYVRPVDGALFGGSDRIEIFEFHTDWGVPGNTTFSLVQTLSPSDFSSDICDGSDLNNNCIPQPGTATQLEASSVWPMGPNNYRNFGDHESLVFNHTVDVDGNGLAGVRWYELRRTGGGPWSIQQEGTFSPPDGQAIHRWMGSVAIDSAGNMALGYSVSNDGIAPHNPVFPGVRYVGRLATDPPGLMPFGEVTLVNGGAAQSPATRWGDYSAMRVDPVDGCTFWYTQQYTAAGPARMTRIGAFRFPTCNGTDLAITKSDSPDPVTAGGQLNYTIGVTNNGAADATQVVVTDTLPAAVVFLSSSIPCAPGPGTQRTCSIGALASGASKSFTIQVRVPANTPPGSITNTATVTGHELDPDASNNTASATTEVIALADLAIAKECKPDQPNTAPAGSTTFCEIYVDNIGPSDAQNVVITDRIISNTSFTVTAIIPTGVGLVCLPAAPIGPTMDTTITCTDAVIPAGGRDTIRVEFSAQNAGDIDDTATVTSTTPDPNSSNNLAKGRVSFSSVADLRITKTAPATVIAGNNMTYHIAITNGGPSAAANVVVHDLLPAGVAFQSATPSAPGTCQAGVVPGDPTKPLTCNFGTIASSGSASIDVLVTVNSDVPAGTVLVNNADVGSTSADPDNSNNIVTVTTTVATSADLRVTKTSDAATYKPSSVVTYSINVVNSGPSKALNVIVTDNLPDLKAAIYQSDTGGCVLSTPTTLTCNLGDMAVGDNRTFFVYVLIHGSKGAVSNTASVASASSPPTPDPTPGNNSSTRVVTIGK